MYRKIMQSLVMWKDSLDRKPLVIKGARQVGKTWVMKEFGKTYYSNYVYLNFDEEESLGSIFENNKNPNRIIELLSLISGKKIVPKETLIIFDEIQECPQALNSLKYFNENAKDYHIVSAGSLLGTLLATPKSYPVGMVNLLEMYPMYFDEFLAELDSNLYKYFMDIGKGQKVEAIFHEKLKELYLYYIIIGGMPECVNAWIKYKDPKKINQIQKELITVYENDFSKHNKKINSGRILMVFRSLVSQLAKANEKFIYGCLKEGARAREFEEAIEWLVSAGMINRVYNVSKPEHPLAAFDQLNHFKLFLFDTGLLKQMAGIDNEAILLNEPYQFKGALSENYILQQLKGQLDVEPRYFATDKGELDFIIQNKSEIIPMEVKAGEDKSAPSFKTYIKEKEPKLAVRFSQRAYVKDGNITNMPLYLAAKFIDLR